MESATLYWRSVNHKCVAEARMQGHVLRIWPCEVDMLLWAVTLGLGETENHG